MPSSDPRQLLLLRSIEELSDLPTEAANASDFYETITQIIMGALGVSRGCIYYCEESSNHLTLLYTKGIKAPPQLSIPDEGINDTTQDLLKESGIHFLIPLKHNRKQVGLIGLGKKLTEVAFTEKDRLLVSPISSLMGLLLSNFMFLYHSIEESKKLREENIALTQALPSRIMESFPYLTVSKKMKTVFQYAQALARERKPILIIGSKGSGHKLITNFIHSISSGPTEGILCFNCAIELPLTAERLRLKEALDTNDENTSISLENVSVLPEKKQEDLFSFLSEQKQNPSEGYRNKTLIFSIIGSQSELEAGDYLIEDLRDFFKDSTIVLPTLKELQEDLPVMIDFAVSFYAQRHKKNLVSISMQAKDYLEKRQWKANISELEYLIEQAVISLPRIESVLQAHHFQSIELKSKVKYIPLPVNMRGIDDVRKAMVQNALILNDGRKSGAAELLGITRQTLNNLITRLNIKGNKA